MDLPEPAHPAHLVPASSPLAARHDVVLLDLDGVVYVGSDAVPYAAESLRQAAEVGMRPAFVTNNASRPVRVVAEHLRELGIECADSDVITSAQAAATMLADQLPAGSLVLVVGGDGLVEALVEHGLRPTFSELDGPAAVAQGFAREIGWALLTEGAHALRRGVPWVATSLDRTVPTPRGPAPGNGSLVAALSAATGRHPQVAGKPEPPLFAEAARRTSAERPLVVGDRLDTDIEGAVRAGAASLLVLTGVTTAVDAVLAPEHARPTYLGRDLRALNQPPRTARVDDQVWRCGSWVALVDRGRVVVAPGGPDPQRGAQDVPGPSPDDVPDHFLDAWVAACAAGWAYAGDLAGVDGLPPDRARRHPAPVG